ncbi:uncharacterized protein LOC107871805 [Capsicum annuum]|uniref:uncharacterized protein LOC107871805 n=1 Tax=Capsicum annuum TaxID=4072 RepID=UPI001FB14793|nr:uncharacterized protein LOC107871805 [Capsicum annuum]
MVITTRSGKLLCEPSVGKSMENKVSIEKPEESSPMKSKNLDGFVDFLEKEDKKEEKVVLNTIPRPSPPFPNRLKKKVDEAKFGKFMAMLKQLTINVPSVEALKKMLVYAKFMKDLITKKRKVSSDQVDNLHHCSAVSILFLVQNKADPGAFTILCKVGSLDIARALCDLGASVNLVPLVLCKKLVLEDPTPTNMRLVMEDRSIKRPVGILHDVLVKLADFILPIDFVVLDCDVDLEIPIILGRPLLATERLIVHMELNELKYSKMEPKRKSPTKPKKAVKDDVHRKLLNEEYNYWEKEPLLRKLKKKQSPKKTPPPPPIEVEDTEDKDQGESKESESEETTFRSPSTEKQDDKETPPRRTLIKCENP